MLRCDISRSNGIDLDRSETQALLRPACWCSLDAAECKVLRDWQVLIRHAALVSIL
jgi:hypothetical protein